ncbi:MAG: glycine--tRNA ligase [Thermoprotei archaeon]|jgi:glycyl-tRNA synthetase
MYEKIMELSKRRGFLWQSFEIYGGMAGYVDFGPLGTKLKRNIENSWRNFFVKQHEDFIVEIETPIIMPAVVFKASGHLDHFTDFMVQCTVCSRIFRADHLVEEAIKISAEGLSAEKLEEIIKEKNIRCPECGGVLGSVQTFNLLMKTTIGPYTGNVAYGRPEAAQGMFINFKRIYDLMGQKLPIGIAQIGRVMRNEISPRQGLLRMREFTIMELELFYDPNNPSCDLIHKVKDKVINILLVGHKEPIEISVKDALERKIILNEWNAYFMAISQDFVESLGVSKEKQLFLEKSPSERAHYSSQTFDQMVYLEDFGWVEVSGHAYRTDYDLKSHMELSGKNLKAYRRLDKPRIVKHYKVSLRMDIAGKVLRDKAPIINNKLQSLDPERIMHNLEINGFIEINGIKVDKDMLRIMSEDEVINVEEFVPHVAEPSFGAERLVYIALENAYTEIEGRIVLRLPKHLAPYKAAVFPLVTRDNLDMKAKEVYELLKASNIDVLYDDTEFIGRLYARADEIGIPISITIDYQTLQDNSVTLRDRDTWTQVRVPIPELPKLLYEYLNNKKRFLELGPIFKEGRK